MCPPHKPRPPQPWQQRVAAAAPRGLKRLLLAFETDIEEGLEAFASELPAGARLLDAGAGECQHARLFQGCRYVAVDLGVGDGNWDYGKLDALANLEALPFQDETFDAALNVVVLEHTREPKRVLAEIRRVLKPGGELLLAAPAEWAEHQVPHDYYRYTRYGLRYLLEQAGFAELRIRQSGRFFTLLGRRLLDAALLMQGGWRWLLFVPAGLVLGPAGLLLPLLDRLDRDGNTTLGFVCRARRPL